MPISPQSILLKDHFKEVKTLKKEKYKLEQDNKILLEALEDKLFSDEKEQKKKSRQSTRGNREIGSST